MHIYSEIIQSRPDLTSSPGNPLVTAPHMPLLTSIVLWTASNFTSLVLCVAYDADVQRAEEDMNVLAILVVTSLN